MTVRHPDIVGAAIIAAVGIAVLAAGLTTPDPGFGVVSPATFPVIIGTLMLAGAGWLGADALRAHAPPVLEAIDRRPLLVTAITSAAFLAAFVPLGFVLSATPFLVVQARVLGSRSLLRDAVACLLFVLAIYVLFVRFLTVDLPNGPLPF